MVSSSPSKRDVGANNLNKSSVPLVPGPRPLAKHKFYLDVKNHITSSKLEAKIKDLGGFLELFLVKEVTHLITDKEGWSTANKGGGNCPKTPQTPSNQSSAYGDHGTPERTPVRGRPKTRADAMLERARKTPTIVAKDPLEQAKNWGITIWSIEKTFNWLEKVTLSINAKKQQRKSKVKELKAPYVKFESFDRKHRPVFLEIRNWPAFNLRASPGSSGLVHKTASEQNMTRKSRTAPAPVTPAAKVAPTAAATQSGYCEVCRAEYPKLEEHLESEKHLAFIRDNANFLDLDNLISDGTDIGSFLKINGTKDEKCNGILDEKLLSPTTYKMPRTRTSSICDKIKSSQMSPVGSDSGHRLRTRRGNTTTLNNYIGITADDEIPTKPEGAREGRELRSSHRNALLKIAEQESDIWSSGRPKRACIRQKLISVDDNVISEHRGYYRVEVPAKIPSPVKETKLEKETREKEKEKERRAKSPVVPPDDKSIIVKFKRMRTSELMQLNSEAENFLFPKKDDTSSSSEEDIDEECPDTTVSTAKEDSTILLSSEEEEDVRTDDDEDSINSVSSSDEALMPAKPTKKKRMTHAEAFIMDNKKYYKFEMPGSRLRYHGSLMNEVHMNSMARNNGNVSPETKRVKDEDDSCSSADEVDDDEEEEEDEGGGGGEGEKLNLEEIKFSFERVPKSETWYETFSRQDQGEQYYTCFSDSGYWQPFLLPYEMGPIQPLDPKLCIQAYHQVKKRLQGTANSGANSASASCSTPDSTSNGPQSAEDETSKASEDSIPSISTAESTDKDEDYFPDKRKRRRKTRKHAIIPSKNPRKSPRQHASTLAILSSLIQQRKRREMNRLSNKARSSSNLSLEAIPETEPLVVKNKRGPKKKVVTEDEASEDLEVVAKSIDNVLSSALEDVSNMDQLEICTQDNPFSTDYKIDAIEIMENYEEVKCNTQSAVRRPPRRKPGRKKTNRTGWPKKSRRRKGGNAQEEVDSTVDSVSVIADSEIGDDSNLQDDLAAVKDPSELVNNKTDQSSVNNSECGDRVTASENVLIKSERVVDLDKWENAEKVLAAKINNDVNNDLLFQPYVRVQKLNEDGLKIAGKRRLRSSSPPHRTAKRARKMPASPKSPRVLRKPRGRWYRER